MCDLQTCWSFWGWLGGRGLEGGCETWLVVHHGRLGDSVSPWDMVSEPGTSFGLEASGKAGCPDNNGDQADEKRRLMVWTMSGKQLKELEVDGNQMLGFKSHPNAPGLASGRITWF